MATRKLRWFLVFHAMLHAQPDPPPYDKEAANWRRLAGMDPESAVANYIRTYIRSPAHEG